MKTLYHLKILRLKTLYYFEYKFEITMYVRTRRGTKLITEQKHQVNMYKIPTSTLGIQIRNMKMVFKFYGTWRWVTFEKLMMKIYVFF